MENKKYEELERQVERGGLFTHTILSHHTDRLNEAEAFLYGIIDVLTQKGLATPDEIQIAAEKVRDESVLKQEEVSAGIVLRHDDENARTFIPVDCAVRMPVCKAVCCRLDFALSVEEIETGKIKWDIGRPYHIRQAQNGYCTHINTEQGHCCTVYQDRPAVCRTYSCAGDARIWKDFDAVELNEEWIAQHLGVSKPKFIPPLAYQ